MPEIQRIQLTEDEAAKALKANGFAVGSYHDSRPVNIEDRDESGESFTYDTAIEHAQYQLGKPGVNRVVIYKPCAEITEGK